MPVYNVGDAIEGNKISGDSRDPLRSQGRKIVNGIKCFLFKAEFNVHASIVEALPEKSAVVYPEAVKTVGESLSSDTAVIVSLRNKYTRRLESNFTGTHSVNQWDFSVHTGVKVITPRQAILNAIEKRLGMSGKNTIQAAP